MNLSLDIKFTERMFFSVVTPYWLFSYQYNNKYFYVIVDGNDPKRLGGRKPEDAKRKKAVIKLKWVGFFIGSLGTTLALYFFFDEDFGKISLNWASTIICTVGLLGTLLLVNFEIAKVKNKSRRIRQDILAKRLKKLK